MLYRRRRKFVYDKIQMYRLVARQETIPCFYSLNPFTLGGTLKNIVCYSYTFGNNLIIKQKFTKYLKES